jgi:hypothetical protein
MNENKTTAEYKGCADYIYIHRNQAYRNQEAKKIKRTDTKTHV